MGRRLGAGWVAIVVECPAMVPVADVWGAVAAGVCAATVGAGVAGRGAVRGAVVV